MIDYLPQFRWVFRHPISHHAQVEVILEALSTIGDVSVKAPYDDANYTACHPSYGQWSAGIGNLYIYPESISYVYHQHSF